MNNFVLPNMENLREVNICREHSEIPLSVKAEVENLNKSISTPEIEIVIKDFHLKTVGLAEWLK
jgi:hypothetical protein